MTCHEDVYAKVTTRETAVRIVKKNPGMYGLPEFSVDADFDMKLLTTPDRCYETENEFIFYVEHRILADACLISCFFDTAGKYEVVAILCEGRYLSFSCSGTEVRFNFEISGLTGPTRTLFVHTLLREPGVTLRLEQNHPGRQAGMYRNQKFPEVQIKAAQHYCFAMEQILKMMEIPSYLNSNHLGYMLLLGFETNNEVHTDYPPHWHLIHRWPNHCASQAPHIYMAEDGRNTHVTCSLDLMNGIKREFDVNEWCKFVDYYGRDVMAFCVSEEGGVYATKPNGSVFYMSPFTEEGVSIWKDGEQIGSVSVENDTVNGHCEVCWQFASGMPELRNCKKAIAYDPLTGALRSISEIQ